MHENAESSLASAFESVANRGDGTRRRQMRREGTRGTLVVVGNKSKRPTPARRDHPSAIPDRSCPTPPRRPPPIVAVPFDEELGGRVGHTHRRPSAKNDAHSIPESNRNREQSLGRAVAFPRLRHLPPIIIQPYRGVVRYPLQNNWYEWTTSC